MKKRLFLVASLCVTACVVAPLAAASAAEFTGTCVIKGNATFAGNASGRLPKTPFETLEYKFTSGAGTTCIRAGKTEPETASAALHGKGLLSCPASIGGYGSTTEPAGEGTLKVGAEEAKFKFRFYAVAVNVVFEILKGELPLARGTASFAKDTAAVQECGTPGAEGPKELAFEAAAAGTIGE